MAHKCHGKSKNSRQKQKLTAKAKTHGKISAHSNINRKFKRKGQVNIHMLSSKECIAHFVVRKFSTMEDFVNIVAKVSCIGNNGLASYR